MPSYHLKVEPRGDYLYITVSGENSYETVAAYFAEVRELSLQHQMPNLLVVSSLQNLRTALIHQ